MKRKGETTHNKSQQLSAKGKKAIRPTTYISHTTTMANIKEADSEDTSETDYSPKLIKRQKISASSSLGEKILTKSGQPDSPHQIPL